MINDIEERIRLVEQTQTAIITHNKDTSIIISGIKDDINLMLDILDTIKAAMSFFIKLTRFIKWIAGMLVPLAIIWAFVTGVKTGNPPPFMK